MTEAKEPEIASTESQGENVGMRLITVSNAWWPWTGTINLT